MAQQAGSASSNPQTGNNYATNLRQKFGEINDFWNRYNKLADDHDDRLIKTLNDNLDVLLIFAGLFSAVNTSFLQMTTPALSPDPSAEANYLLRLLITKLDNTTFPSMPEPPSQSKDLPSVRANCLLYSSLCCSILAAVGAMLAKEWLQNFEKGGQVGPIRDQVLRRQHKFNGVRHWQLEPMTRLLPTLLLTSVVLFGIGLIEYLVPIDDSVARVVIAFAILAGIFYVFTTAAAAFWDACPYQTSVSKASKYVVESIVIPSIRQLGQWLRRYSGSHGSVPELTVFKSVGDSDQDTEILSAQAACWLLETTSSPKDQQMAIENLISLSPGVCSSLIHDWDTYTRMLSLTLHFIRAWQDKPSDDTIRPAQQFSAALLHLCVGCPRHAVEWTMVKGNLAQVGIEAGEHRGERLSGCLELCLSDSTNTLQASPASIFPKNDYSMKVVTLSMIVLGDVPFWSLDREHAWSALRHVFVDKYDDTILALLALAISEGFPTTTPRLEEKVRNSVRNACLGKDITASLLEGVRSGPIALSQEARPSYIHALPIFTEILHRLGERPSTKTFIGLHPEVLFLDVAELILAVDEIYHTVNSLPVLVLNALNEFMDEAQRLLRKFKPPITEHDSMDTIFNGTLVCFARCNQSTSSTSNAAFQTLEWLNRCLDEYNFVTDKTVSRLMWGLESTESREDVLQLVYTYLSKWGSQVKDHQYKSWVSKGLIAQLLKALSSGASTGSMNMMVPLALRHIIQRATSMEWEVEESEDIMRVGITVINSVNSDTGTTGKAYSLLIFEVVLFIWGNISDDIKKNQMSGEMVQATKRILQVIEELIGNQPGATLTDALRSKIGIMVCSEPINLSPTLLQNFLDDFASKKSDIWTIFGVDTIVDRLRARGRIASDGSTPNGQT